MSDSTMSYRVSGTKRMRSHSAYIYEDQFYVASESDLSTYAPDIDSKTPWLEGMGPTTSIDPRVKEVRITSLTPRNEPPYIVDVTSHVPMLWIQIGYGGGLDDKISVEYDTISYPMPIEWFGVKLATQKEVDDSICKLERDTMEASSTVCRINDFVYCNCALGNNGTPDTKFSDLASSDHPDVKYAGKRVKMSVAKIKFYSQKSASVFLGFDGISGSIPSRFGISTDAGLWRAEKNMVKPSIQDINGQKIKCFEIYRELVMAPLMDGNQSKWNSGKLPTWDWEVT